MFNAHHDVIRFFLPRPEPERSWETVLNTSLKDWGRRLVPEDSDYALPARSVAVFRMVEPPGSGETA